MAMEGYYTSRKPHHQIKFSIISGTFAVIRNRFFKVNNLTDLFENVKIDDILSFLRETELYQKI